MGHGKPEKSWNLRISFPGLLALESHGKLKFCLVLKLLQMIMQGQCKIERSD